MTDLAERNPYRGQTRLVRLQTVNWGTFDGYKDFPIDAGGILLTGKSGSGKSSLLDGLSTVLLPSGDLHLNASADLSAKGAKANGRSVIEYVRGAWSESTDELARVRSTRPPSNAAVPWMRQPPPKESASLPARVTSRSVARALGNMMQPPPAPSDRLPASITPSSSAVPCSTQSPPPEFPRIAFRA